MEGEAGAPPAAARRGDRGAARSRQLVDSPREAWRERARRRAPQRGARPRRLSRRLPSLKVTRWLPHLPMTPWAPSRSASGRFAGSASERCGSPGRESGAPARSRRRHRRPAASGGARRQPDRHRQLVRAERQRGADCRGPLSLSGGSADRHQGRAVRTGPGRGWPADGRPEHLEEACEARSDGCGSTPSSSTSTTAPIRRCRMRFRSVRSRAPGGGQDSPHRRLQRLSGPARDRPRDR